MASTAASMVPKAVMTTTSVSGETVLLALSNSVPLMPGMIRSVSITWT